VKSGLHVLGPIDSIVRIAAERSFASKSPNAIKINFIWLSFWGEKQLLVRRLVVPGFSRPCGFSPFRESHRNRISLNCPSAISPFSSMFLSFLSDSQPEQASRLPDKILFHAPSGMESLT
jgi:hypothetical protein